MASTLPAAAPAASTELPADAQVPYLLTTRPNGFLPDMTGFEPQRVGSLAQTWSMRSVQVLKSKRIGTLARVR